MQESRRQVDTSVDGIAGDNDQPKIKPSKIEKRNQPLIGADKGPILAAIITLAGSLLMYSIGQIRHIDERLDILEQDAKVVLDGMGGVRPSKAAIDAYYQSLANDRRLRRLEQRQDDVD